MKYIHYDANLLRSISGSESETTKKLNEILKDCYTLAKSNSYSIGYYLKSDNTTYFDQEDADVIYDELIRKGFSVSMEKIIKANEIKWHFHISWY